jgi:two-component system chemotaxis response regulator CheY
MAKILVVDDSKTILKMISKYLTDDHHEIITADDGLEALDIFQREKGMFGLVITDINMPNMNGMELTEKIRTGDIKNDIPIVVLSTEESDKIKEEGKRVGVSAWIVKPPKPELLKQVAKHFCPDA